MVGWWAVRVLDPKCAVSGGFFVFLFFSGRVVFCFSATALINSTGWLGSEGMDGWNQLGGSRVSPGVAVRAKERGGERKWGPQRNEPHFPADNSNMLK